MRLKSAQIDAEGAQNDTKCCQNADVATNAVAYDIAIKAAAYDVATNAAAYDAAIKAATYDVATDVANNAAA